MTATSQVNILGKTAHGINNFHLLIELHPLLREITKTDCIADNKSSGIRFYLTKQHFNKGTLTCTIRAYNSHLFVTRKVVIKVLEYNFTRETLAHIRSLENL